MPDSPISTGLGSEVMSRTEKRNPEPPAPSSQSGTTREVDAMRQLLPIQSIGVLAESELSTSARLVAVMLMYHVNLKNGLCYPSISTLALECGCQPTTIKKAITELREFGFVEWETKLLPRTSTRVNHYNLLFAHWSENDQWNDHTNDQPNDWPNDQPSDRSNIGHKLIKQIKQKEELNTKVFSSISSEKDTSQTVPQGKILELYREELPFLRQPRTVRPNVQVQVRARWNEKLKEGRFHDENGGLEYFRRYFRYVAQNGFLSGRKTSWKADYEWLMKAANFDKVTTGKYAEDDGK